MHPPRAAASGASGSPPGRSRQAVIEACAVVAETSKQDAIHANAACSGGIVTAAALGHLQATANRWPHPSGGGTDRGDALAG
jgi:hypothetical protein